MGQAWCKEKTSKAQDSKSPLDRVFVRCAHRIYPGLKEDGSVLGGATQRVTSSEIGYAGSPPREVLARGRSIDSVDRPFHPSEWVDVNLEVPSTPRPSSVLTNLTVDTSLYPATTPTSSCSNLKDATPVPPPRRRKRNKGRPLPPKPDEIPQGNPGQREPTEEPLYSSVKPPRAISYGDRHEDEEPKQEARRAKEIYEHKVNGTGRIIPRDVVSGKRSYQPDERRGHRISDCAPQHRRIQEEEDEDYERFAKSTKDSSTPSRQPDKARSRESKDEGAKDSKDQGAKGSTRTKKNYSTVSLPNYSELDTSRHTTQARSDGKAGGPRRPVRSSTGSLPAGSFLAPFSEKTSVRLEDYIPRRGSTENLSPYEVLGKLHAAKDDEEDLAEDPAGFLSYDPSKLEDWGMADIGNCELNQHRRLSFESLAEVGDVKQSDKGEDVVDFLSVPESGKTPVNVSASSSPILVQKPSGFGRTASLEEENPKSERSNGPHARIYEPPTLEHCRLTGNCDQSSSPVCTEPFFLDEEKQRAVLDTIGGGCRNGLQDGSRMILGRRLSNESEPDVDPYESKELTGRGSDLIRTISEESLPREMLEVPEDREMDDFFEVKLAKDVHNKLKKDQVEQRSRTPPPSPEPRIKAEILENDHASLLRVLKEEAEESNLSSMTPSLTELEAALSDMLEKEEPEVVRDERRDESRTRPRTTIQEERPIEPEIVPVERQPGFKDEPGQDDRTALDERDESRSTKGRKVSFCAWDEANRLDFDDQDKDQKSKGDQVAGHQTLSPFDQDDGSRLAPLDHPPAKPSRLHASPLVTDDQEPEVPTPPRRRNKSSPSRRDDPDDRLI